MENLQDKIEKSLKLYLSHDDTLLEKKVFDAMEYSLSAGGKRIRPILTLEFCRACGGNIDNAIPFACAVEMIHTYSLIHDDLPCMDNDAFRRGKPSNHMVYGEDIALLAGDALMTMAFEILSSQDTIFKNGSENCIKAVNVLSQRAGAYGMIGGQVIDLESENKSVSIDILQEMDTKKTAKLISSACEIGCISAGASDDIIDYAKIYAQNIGMAFQIIDDILDITSDMETLGKPIGSDKENNKSTYVSLLGIDKCMDLAETLTNSAIKVLDNFNSDTTNLKEIALKLLKRRK